MKDENQTKSVHEATRMDEYAGNVILHISDLHFLEDTTHKKTNIEKELFSVLENLELEWKPNIVCITGDISDKNNIEGYSKAEKLIKTLLDKLGISADHLVMCPGNHDVDTEKAKLIKCPQNAQEVERELKIPIPLKYENIFSLFKTLCENLGIRPFDYNGASSYLFGVKKINNMHFIVCNSCWFCNAENNKGMIGLPLLEHLENKYAFSETAKTNSAKIIALIHHPEKGLNSIDTVRYYNRPALGFLTEIADLVLTGHLHSLPVGKSEYNSTPFLNCGATLQDSVENTFVLIRSEEDRFVYQFYRTDKTRFKNRWIKEDEQQNILCNASQAIVNTFYDKNGTRSLLENKLSETSFQINKHSREQWRTTTQVNFGLLGFFSKLKNYMFRALKIIFPILKPVLEPISNINYVLDLREIQNQLAKAERNIKKLEFRNAFAIADNIEEKLESLCSLNQNESISEIYTRIGLIECTRASWLHLTQGKQEDYSRAKKYLERAKNAYKKW